MYVLVWQWEVRVFLIFLWKWMVIAVITGLVSLAWATDYLVHVATDYLVHVATDYLVLAAHCVHLHHGQLLLVPHPAMPPTRLYHTSKLVPKLLAWCFTSSKCVHGWLGTCSELCDCCVLLSFSNGETFILHIEMMSSYPELCTVDTLGMPCRLPTVLFLSFFFTFYFLNVMNMSLCRIL